MLGVPDAILFEDFLTRGDIVLPHTGLLGFELFLVARHEEDSVRGDSVGVDEIDQLLGDVLCLFVFGCKIDAGAWVRAV